MDDLTRLETRAGLPDALRVLLADYPRPLWEADAGFDGLIRFWLDRHLMFRRLLSDMTKDTQGFMDGRIGFDTYAGRLSRTGSGFVQHLHGHHQIEDAHYFPKLAGLDTRISTGFDILDADHHALDGHLGQFVELANAVFQDSDDTDAAGRFHTGLLGLAGFLDRHLTDEEDLIVPVLLKFGSAGLD